MRQEERGEIKKKRNKRKKARDNWKKGVRKTDEKEIVNREIELGKI